jgi:hypothetical protein
MHMTFQIPYVYDNQIIQATSTSHSKSWKCNIGQAKPDIENIRGLNLAAVRRTTVQVFFLHNPTLFAIWTSTFSKLCKNLLSGM